MIDSSSSLAIVTSNAYTPFTKSIDIYNQLSLIDMEYAGRSILSVNQLSLIDMEYADRSILSDNQLVIIFRYLEFKTLYLRCKII